MLSARPQGLAGQLFRLPRTGEFHRGKLPVGLSGDAVTHEEYPIVHHHEVTDQTGNPS
jgi:hypothetical protein